MTGELVPAAEVRPPTSSGLRGRQRVAAALVAMGSEKAAEILKRMSDGSWKIHRTIWNEIPPPAPPAEAKKP